MCVRCVHERRLDSIDKWSQFFGRHIIRDWNTTIWNDDQKASEIREHEKKAIEFLLKYDRFHPVNDTIAVQNNLHIMWNVLAYRY